MTPEIVEGRYGAAEAAAKAARKVVRDALVAESNALLVQLLKKSVKERLEELEKPNLELIPADRRKLVRSLQMRRRHDGRLWPRWPAAGRSGGRACRTGSSRWPCSGYRSLRRSFLPRPPITIRPRNGSPSRRPKSLACRRAAPMDTPSRWTFHPASASRSCGSKRSGDSSLLAGRPRLCRIPNVRARSAKGVLTQYLSDFAFWLARGCSHEVKRCRTS